jgi:hypothetical protein
VADGGEEECRVFTQGSHIDMIGDGQAAAGEGGGGGRICSFFGFGMEAAGSLFWLALVLGLPIFSCQVWNLMVTALFTFQSLQLAGFPSHMEHNLEFRRFPSQLFKLLVLFRT